MVRKVWNVWRVFISIFFTFFNIEKKSDFFFSWLNSPSGPTPSLWSSSITIRHTSIGKTPLSERSARRRDLYQTKSQHSRETDIHPVGFQPAFPASKWPQTYTLDLAVTGICEHLIIVPEITVSKLLYRYKQQRDVRHVRQTLIHCRQSRWGAQSVIWW